MMQRQIRLKLPHSLRRTKPQQSTITLDNIGETYRCQLRPPARPRRLWLGEYSNLDEDTTGDCGRIVGKMDGDMFVGKYRVDDRDEDGVRHYWWVKFQVQIPKVK
jgi:hypothetical protein